MDILSFHRFQGILETAPAIWAAQRLLEGTTDRAALRLAHAFLRQALEICPYDPDLGRLAMALARQAAVPWSKVPDQGPALKEIQPDLDESSPDTLIALAKKRDAPPILVHMALASMWAGGHHPDRFSELVRALAEHDPGNRGLPLLAWGLHALGQDDAAMFENCPPSFLGEALKSHLARQDGDKALHHLQRALELEPSLPHLVERIAQLDLLTQPLPDPKDFRVHVLFYTFNKLETTIATLRSLLASDIGPTRITLLNNGSTAFTQDEFSAAVASAAQGREVELVHLPVNIGAPAARNWLYRLPQVQEADYVAFLDDDVLLPSSWLRMYLQDMADHPEVCAVGPKGLNPNPFRTIQYVWRYFEEVGERKIRFTNNAPMNLDLGQFDGRRPCLSVMGCCHMFDRRKLARLGVPDFDVRFTPSQVDDLERDIQIWKHGGRVLYDGRVEVVHMQDAGRAAPKTEASWGHVWGNHMKMEFKLTGRELRDIDEQVRAVEEKHWKNCLAKAWEHLPATCQDFWKSQTTFS
jgi:GT2 family glycosyltransferase